MNKTFMYISILLLMVYTLSAQAQFARPSCPETFPEAQRISAQEMQKVLKSAQKNDEIQIHRSNLSSDMSFAVPDSSEAAIVVFAIIGIVVVVAWIPYALMYLYDLKHGQEQYCPWYNLSLRHKSIKSTGPELDIDRSASFTGLNLGIASLNEDYSYFGLGVELGHHNITDKGSGFNDTFLGQYLLFGPKISLGKPYQDNISLSLLGGTSTHPDVSVIAEANLGWSINLNSQAENYAPTLNLNMGANYLDIKETEGILKNINEYALFLGFGVGLNF